MLIGNYIAVGLLWGFSPGVSLRWQNDHSKPNYPAKQNPTPQRFSKNGHVELVLVPADEFDMGDDDIRDNKRHRVFLSAYQIGRTPVTVGQYKAYCKVKHIDFTKIPKPKWGWIDDHPMVNVNWHEARAFCIWAGGDLPTEAQWEKAARGTQGLLFPWGNRFDGYRAQWSSDGVPGSAKMTSPVNAHPSGASPCGCLDMAGNVLQRCFDKYKPIISSLPLRDPKGPAQLSSDPVVRGGSWLSFKGNHLRTSFRGSYNPTLSDNYIGFRLAVDPKNPLPSQQYFMQQGGLAHTALPKLPNTKLSKRGDVELVPIPAGNFAMGDDDLPNNKRHTVFLDAFQIGRTPVTVGQYKAYCIAKRIDFSRFTTPRWGWVDDEPMVNVNWQEARDFCIWAGGDLPTEAQWEKAARGTGGRLFPWGNRFDGQRLQWSRDGVPGSAEATQPVTTYASSASLYGCLGMAGNVWQWCFDAYQPIASSKPQLNPTGPPHSRSEPVVRGGSWLSFKPKQFRTGFRGYHNANLSENFIGFRLAVDAKHQLGPQPFLLVPGIVDQPIHYLNPRRSIPSLPTHKKNPHR